MQKLFICTDLDRTLLPNGTQSESPEAREKFAQLVNRSEVTLAYVSGRNLHLVQEAIASYQLPMPDWIVGDVGSTIYQFQDNEWQYWQSWEDVISTDWQGRSANELLTLFKDLTDLTPQEMEKQNRFKLSYYVPLDLDLAPLQNEVTSRLQRENMAASLIYSVDEAAAIGLLDILPAIATKLHAIQFLMQHQGFANSHTIFAGDSGNDLPAIVSDIPAVLVANAHPAVIKQAQAQIKQNGNQDYFYLAKGNFLGMNGNYSAGILEGIAHYYPSIKDWMIETDEMLSAKYHVSNLD